MSNIHSNIYFTMIAAMCAKTRGIGYQGTIPWKSKEDMAFFRKTTTEVPSDEYTNAVIMGRKTFESLGSRPLKGRLNVVCTRSVNRGMIVSESVLLAGSLDEALEKIALLPAPIHKIFVIGGEQLYREGIAHPGCCELQLNYMKIPVRDYDTFFPEVDPHTFELTERYDTEDVVYTKYTKTPSTSIE
jgi:dihydrofolate reductase